MPQGSHRAFVKGDRAVLVATTHKLRAWRANVRLAAEAHLLGAAPTSDLVSVRLRFYLPAIKDRRKMLQPPNKRPDIDKLTRAVLDALTGTLYLDDSQVWQLMAEKLWGGPTGGVEVSYATNHEAGPTPALPPNERVLVSSS